MQLQPRINTDKHRLGRANETRISQIITNSCERFLNEFVLIREIRVCSFIRVNPWFELNYYG